MEYQEEIFELTNATRKLIKYLINIYIISGNVRKQRRKAIRSFVSIAPCCDSSVDIFEADHSTHDVLIVKMDKKDKNFLNKLVVKFSSVPQDAKSHFKFTMGLIHRIIFPCIQKPLVIFNTPICCLSYANINIDKFRSEFTLFLGMRPRVMEFEEFYAFCKVLLLTFNKLLFGRTCCNICYIKKKIKGQMSLLNMHIFYQFSLYLFYRNIYKFNIDASNLRLIYKKLNGKVQWNYFRNSYLFFKRVLRIKFTRHGDFLLENCAKRALKYDLTDLSCMEAETLDFPNELYGFSIKIEKEALKIKKELDDNLNHVGLMNLVSRKSIDSDKIENIFSEIVPAKKNSVNIDSCKILKESISVQSNEKDIKVKHMPSIDQVQIVEVLENSNSSSENEVRDLSDPNIAEVIGILNDSNSSVVVSGQYSTSHDDKDYIKISDDCASSVMEGVSASQNIHEYDRDGSNDSGLFCNRLDNKLKEFFNYLHRANEGSSNDSYDSDYYKSLSTQEGETRSGNAKPKDERVQRSVDEGKKTIDHFRFFSSLEGVKNSTSNGSTFSGVKDPIKDETMEISRLKSLNFSSGNEEVDEIDGIQFISFETENEMNDYTLREKFEIIKTVLNKYRNNPKSSLPPYVVQKLKNIQKSIISVNNNKPNPRINAELKMLDDCLKFVNPHNIDDLFDEDSTVVKPVSSSKDRPRKRGRKSTLERPTTSGQKGRKPESYIRVASMSSDSEDSEPIAVSNLEDKVSNIISDSALSVEYAECLSHTGKTNGHKLKSEFVKPSLLADLKRKMGIKPCTVKLERLPLPFDTFPMKENSTSTVKDGNVSKDLGDETQNIAIKIESRSSIINSCNIDDATYSENVSKNELNRLPIILPCNKVNGGHDACFDLEKHTNMNLGLVLNIGKNRPFPKEVSENLELLKTNSNIVDNRWALIAASAVVSRKSPKTLIRRVIVPVLSKPILEKALLHLKLLADKRNSTKKVNKVVSDIVEYVVNRDYFENLTFEYDPDVPFNRSPTKSTHKKQVQSKVERELRKLINVTVINQCSNKSQTQLTYKCSNDFCVKGCICDSLNHTQSSSHCNKEICMFNCVCSNLESSENQYQLMRSMNRLTKEESSWHQTIIYKDNSIEFQGKIGNSKRTKKIPTRYQDDVIYGIEMVNILDKPKHINHQNLHLPISKASKDSTKLKQPNEATKKSPTTLFKPETPVNDSEPDQISLGGHNKSKACKDSTKLSHKLKKTNEATKISSLQKSQTNLCKPETSVNDSEPDQMNLGRHNKRKRNLNKNDEVNSKPKRSIENVERKKIEDEETYSDVIEEEIHSDDIEEESYSEALEEDMTWPDVYWLWCSIHSRYGCSCIAQLYFLKTTENCKITDSRFKLLKKEIPNLISSTPSLVYHLYNRSNHSARTFGAIIDYAKRNKSLAFKNKRLYEFQNNIPSFSNSLMKIKPMPIKLKLSRKNSKDFDVCGYVQENKSEDTPNAENYEKKDKPLHGGKNVTPPILFSHIKKKSKLDLKMPLKIPVLKQIKSNSKSDNVSMNILPSAISLAKLFPSEATGVRNRVFRWTNRSEPAVMSNDEGSKSHKILIPSAGSATGFIKISSLTNCEEASIAHNTPPTSISIATGVRRIRQSTNDEEAPTGHNTPSPSTSISTVIRRIRPSINDEETPIGHNTPSPSTSIPTVIRRIRPSTNDAEAPFTHNTLYPSTSIARGIIRRTCPSTNDEETPIGHSTPSPSKSIPTVIRRIRPSTSDAEAPITHNTAYPSTSIATGVIRRTCPSTNDEETPIAQNTLSPLTINAAGFRKLHLSTSDEEASNAPDHSPQSRSVSHLKEILGLTNKEQPFSLSPNKLSGSTSDTAAKFINQSPTANNVRPENKYSVGPAYSNTTKNLQTNYKRLKMVPVLSKGSLNDLATYRMSLAPSTNNKGHKTFSQDIKSNPEPQNSEGGEKVYGLLCLTKGLGYLPVKSVLNGNIVIQDPIAPNVYHSFKNTNIASKWLNKFFKNHLLFEDFNVFLHWALVEGDTLKNSHPFDISILKGKKSKIVTKYGQLVDKREWIRDRMDAQHTETYHIIPAPPKRAAQDDPNPGRKKYKKVNIQSITFDNGKKFQMDKETEDVPTIEISDDEDV